MPSRQEIAQAAAAGLRAFAGSVAETPVMIGFDGFIDSIIDVVDKRHSPAAYDEMATIDTFGGRISAAAGKSANFELVVKLKKLGGNGPIMANAMAAAGLGVHYIGAVGAPVPGEDKLEVDPVFAELAERSQAVHCIAKPGMTDALEFSDGKLMLGKYDHLASFGVEELKAAIDPAAFAQLVGQSRLIGMINWVMMPTTQTIWEYMINEVLPKVGDQVGGQRRMIFIDLCDPAKRTEDDLREAMSLLTKMNACADVVFGLNLQEASQVADVLGLGIGGDPEAAIEDTASNVREALNITCCVVHPRSGAAASFKPGDGDEQRASFKGPFVKQPKLSTGAGDNFNAGFCLGLLASLPIEQCLCTGTGTSGYYVRNAASPTLEQLAGFCDELPEPQG